MELLGLCGFVICFGLIVAMKAGTLFERRRWIMGSLLFAFSVATATAGASGIYLGTVGRLTDELTSPLPASEIYEVITQSPPLKDGRSAVIIRDRYGKFSAYFLKKEPPAIFKIELEQGGRKSLTPYPNERVALYEHVIDE